MSSLKEFVLGVYGGPDLPESEYEADQAAAEIEDAIKLLQRLGWSERRIVALVKARYRQLNDE